MTVTCPACGRDTPVGFPRCANCGAELVAAAEPAREERKVVSVLFCDLVGSTAQAEALDPEDVSRLLSRYHEHVRGELERYGGTVEKFIGDAVMALFGAPTAREDDPERAVRAALAIRDWALDEGDLQVRIGITTGEALVRLGSHPERGESMASGDVVNTAARLQSAAPVDGILVDETTQRATAGRFDVEEAGPVEAKGKAEPIAVWAVRQARSRYGVDVRQHGGAALVGRTRELEAMLGALGRARDEPSVQLVTLVGVPGIGKSRIVWEVFRRLEQGPDLVRWRQGRSLPFGEGMSFWALGEMVKSHAGIFESDTAAEARSKLAAAIADVPLPADERPWVERHLQTLLGAAEGDTAGGDARQEAFTAWRRFLEALAEERLLVLVFEDLHWADDGLLDFVDHLVDWARGVPIFVVCTARPELLERRPAWGGGALNAMTLALSALTENESAVLLGALLDRPVLAADTQKALLERAGGNPFYAEQYARLFRERGSVEDAALPESVQGIIAARLDGLAEAEKRVLQDAAVIGKVFWAGALAALGAPAGLDELLHSLERKDFVRSERRSSVAGERELAFRHALVRDVAYGQIPRGARSERHRLAAAWIEGLGRPDDHADLIAHHHSAALEYARAVGDESPELIREALAALHRAGERALSVYGFVAAARYYESALQLVEDTAPEWSTLVFGQTVARFSSGEATLPELTAVADALLAAGAAEPAAEVLVMCTEAAWHVGDHDASVEARERAMTLAEELGASRARAAVLAASARYTMLAGHQERAVEIARSALPLVEELGLVDLEISLRNSLGGARSSLGESEGIAELQEAVRLAERVGSPEVVRAYNNLAASYSRLGDTVRGVELNDRGIEAAQRFGLEAMARFGRGNRSGGSHSLGLWDRALGEADEFLAEIEAGSPHYLEHTNRLTRALIRLGRDNVDGALSDIARALEHARANPDPQSLFPSLAVRAVVFDELGREQEARDTARELVELILGGRSGRIPYAGPPEVVWMHERFGFWGRLRRHFSRAPTPLLEAGNLVADRDFGSAIAIYAGMGLRTHEARTRLIAGRELAAEGRRAEAEAELAQAATFYRSVDATRYLQQCEATLARSA